MRESKRTVSACGSSGEELCLNSTVGGVKNSDLNDMRGFNIRLPLGCHAGRARANQYENKRQMTMVFAKHYLHQHPSPGRYANPGTVERAFGWGGTHEASERVKVDLAKILGICGY